MEEQKVDVSGHSEAKFKEEIEALALEYAKADTAATIGPKVEELLAQLGNPTPEPMPSMWDLARSEAGSSDPAGTPYVVKDWPSYYNAQSLAAAKKSIINAGSWPKLPGGYHFWKIVYEMLSQMEAYANGTGEFPTGDPINRIMELRRNGNS